MNCYAAQLGNCSGKLSREHYISKSALELAGKTVRVTGFSWQRTNDSTEIGINSLTSKMLCEQHNSELSSLDEVGKAFLLALKSSFDAATTEREFLNEAFKIEGEKLELWLLKVLCGFFRMSRVAHIPSSWIEILFQKRPFAENSGLHFFTLPGNVAWKFNLLRVLSVQDKHGNIAGAKFGIGGLAALLAFGKPSFEEAGIESLYRPTNIQIIKGTNTKSIEFSWGSYQGQGSMTMHISEIVEEKDLHARPLVKPYRK